ncbi:MAG: adenylate/guanylate cyclase domain-containing protein, partial [Chloroflexota bacterium]
MECPRCQTVNPDGAKFCLNCGTALVVACPNCRTPLPAGAKFCFNCGHKLSVTSGQLSVASDQLPVTNYQPPAPNLQQYIPPALLTKLEAARASGGMQGERRIVTILFCDIKGSTALAETLDPEEWADIMNGAFPYLIAPVYRYEGTLARLMGDAILAFFGAPIAHEDDPQRAILAGLDILEGIRPYREQLQRERGLDFDLRVGINTGLVVVGEVGSDLRVEYTAMGDAVNLAARMEQTAAPGTVQIAGDTHKLVAPLFEFEDLGAIEVKGKSEPVPAYRVLRPQAQPGRLRGLEREGLSSPLIGRQRDMDTLLTTIAHLRQGRGQIVSVIGEAGLGKSRLVAELRATTKTDNHPLWWYEGRCLSYKTATPYTPFLELLPAILGWRPEANDAEKYGVIRSTAGADLAPFLATLLDVPVPLEDSDQVYYLQPPQLRQRVFHATCAFMERLATKGPAVLVFDDLHWADATSLELLEQLMAVTERARLLVIALFRPRRQEPAWRFHEVAARHYAHRYTPVTLEPLDDQNARALVANLLHVEDLPEKVRALILHKAEGNPFFVEEVIRSLLDSRLVVRQNSHWVATREIENIAVPDTLAGVITARLDRLDEEAKRVAQTASVIGRTFAFDTLRAVHGTAADLDKTLLTLQQRELVRETAWRIYHFKHVLTQETAYASLLLRRRRQLHRRAAEHLEQTEKERANDIARHWLEAREESRALPYLVEAGERAARAYATAEAVTYYSQAIKIVQGDGAGQQAPRDLARRAYEGLGGAQTLTNEPSQAVDTYQTMLAWAKSHDDAPMQVSALNKLSYVLALRLGQFPAAVPPLDSAENLARQHQDKVGLSEMFIVRCMMCTAAADFEGVIRYMGEAVQLGRELNVKQQMVVGLAHVANTQILMTEFEKAWVTAQEALQLSRQIGDREHEADVLATTIPFYHWRNGDLTTAWQTAVEGTALAGRIGAAYPHSMGAFTLATLARQLGLYEQAIDYLQQSLTASQAVGAPLLDAMILCALGAVYLDISDQLLDKALEVHRQAAEVLEQPAGLLS